ncbi:MAG: type II secretion system GspH family protein [Fimbriimonadales bacterium]|nr:type II secretion system GspH family protein [Fimbriimonadales bacterium]
MMTESCAWCLLRKNLLNCCGNFLLSFGVFPVEEIPQSEGVGMRRQAFQRGFKLIELLVVMAILILLAGIVWVMTRSSREAAARSQCMQNLRQIAIATYQYMIDYQTIYDSPFSLMDYLKDRQGASAEKIFICPRDRLQVPIREAASSYYWSVPTEEPPQTLLREHPNKVLLTCEHHLGLPLLRRGDWAGYDYDSTPSWPFLIVLRVNGSVETIHSCQVRQVRRRVGNMTVLSPIYPGEEGYEQATERYDLYHWCR